MTALASGAFWLLLDYVVDDSRSLCSAIVTGVLALAVLVACIWGSMCHSQRHLHAFSLLLQALLQLASAGTSIEQQSFLQRLGGSTFFRIIMCIAYAAPPAASGTLFSQNLWPSACQTPCT